MPNETDALLLPSTAEGDENGLEWEHEPEEDPSQYEEATRVYARMKQAVASSDLTQSAREALSVEYHHVQAALVDHLQEANDEGIRDFILTMGLTKNLSLLPSKPEVVQAAEEMEDAVVSLRRRMSVSLPAVSESEQQPSPEKKEAAGAPVPLSAYLTLASAVTALSSIGPFLAKQQGVDATMKIVWRFQGTAVLLAPLALHSVLADTGWPRLTYAQWGTFVTAAASYAVLCVAFAMSINYTTVANATILTNSQSILLVAAKCFVGQNVLFLEVFGVAVAFLGGVLCARESAGDEGAPAQGWLSVWGDCLGLISSVGGIGYIVLGKSLRSHMPVLFFMVLNMATASFLILFYMWITGIEFSWGRNVNHGVFGWMNLQGDRLPLELATVFVCNVLGTMGYVRAFKYFSSVIIAVAALMEPVVAAFTAVAMGVGVLPGVEGWIGNFLVGAGTLAVLYPTTQQGISEKEKVAKGIPTPRTPYPRLQSPRHRMPAAVALRKAEQDTDRSLP